MPEYVHIIWVFVAGILGVLVGAWIMFKRAEAATEEAFRRTLELHEEQHRGCAECEEELEEIFNEVDAELREEGE